MQRRTEPNIRGRKPLASEIDQTTLPPRISQGSPYLGVSHAALDSLAAARYETREGDQAAICAALIDRGTGRVCVLQILKLSEHVGGRRTAPYPKGRHDRQVSILAYELSRIPRPVLAFKVEGCLGEDGQVARRRRVKPRLAR